MVRSQLGLGHRETLEVFDYCQLVGIPLAPVLEALASQLDSRLALEQAVARGKTGSLITATMLRWLPWLVLAASEWMGLRPLAFLWGSVLGKSLLVIAVLLSVAAAVVTRRMVQKASRMPADSAVWFQAVALAVRVGARADLAVDLLPGSGAGETCRAWVTSRLLAGTPLAAGLEQEAAAMRRAAASAKEIELAQLPFRLLAPLGSLLLPQFGLLLVIPLLVNAAQQASLVTT
ncbi:MAG: type II secretion system F family protein [Micrococcales bacterium]